MKRTIAFILAFSLAVISAAGCSSSNNTSEAEKNNTSSEAVSSEEASEAEAEEPVFELDPTPITREKNKYPDLEEVKAQYAESEADISEMLEQIAEKKECPCINITTESEYPIMLSDSYMASVIDVFNCDEQYRLSAAGGVKVRGNSSADQGEEKPYRIKFEEKHNMLGLHDGKEYKSWVLLRSYWNLGTDYTAQNLAKVIFDGKYYNTDVMYVNLYINGRSKGIYVLCEQNQAEEGRVDVYEPKEGETQGEIGYLLEIDNYPDETHPFFVMDYEGAELEDISGQKRQFVPAEVSIKSEINTQGQLDQIEKYTTGAFKILYEAAENDTAMTFDSALNVVPTEDMTPQEAADAVIDLESLANMVILEELVHNYDVGEGSFYMARDFSEGSNYQKLTFMAPWDFNWAYEGSSSGKYYACTFQPEVGDQDRSNPWLITAMKADWFQEIVKTKWADLTDNGKLNQAAKKVINDAEALRNDLGDEEWKIDKVTEIIGFVYGRIDWLSDQWK